MVTRVHKNRKSKYDLNSKELVPKGQVLEIEGRQEVCVQVGIDGIQYKDWISIRDYEGSIKLKGNHVHELVTAILRFSSKRMRDNYRQLLDMTDVVTGSAPYKQESFDGFQIEQERLRRKSEKEWNEKMERKISHFICTGEINEAS